MKPGWAFCCLMSSLIGEDSVGYSMDSLSPQDKRKNLKLAFDAAEKVGIYPMLDIEDMCATNNPDPKSVTLYLSEIYKKFN